MESKVKNTKSYRTRLLVLHTTKYNKLFMYRYTYSSVWLLWRVCVVVALCDGDFRIAVDVIAVYSEQFACLFCYTRAQTYVCYTFKYMYYNIIYVHNVYGHLTRSHSSRLVSVCHGVKFSTRMCVTHIGGRALAFGREHRWTKREPNPRFCPPHRGVYVFYDYYENPWEITITNSNHFVGCVCVLYWLYRLRDHNSLILYLRVL